jgi:protocatechuate 3,4-dioxygenase beta subunit
MNTTYRREPDVHPPLDSPAYGSTRLRAPARSPLVIPHTLSEVTGPALGERDLGPLDADLTRQHAGEPLGERMILHGRVVDGNGRPVPHTLVELWQANAAGRYLHDLDRHPAPLDPNFSGAGRCLTDAEGNYRFITIKPGAYPW